MASVFRDPAHEAAFDREGYFRTPLLSEAEVARLRTFFDALPPHCDAGFYASMYAVGEEFRQKIYDEVRAVFAPILARLVNNYRVCVGNFMVKEPRRADSSLYMHQDWSFVDEPRERAVHIWVPLVDVDESNGCLAIVAGSHLLSDVLRPHADPCPLREVMPQIEAEYLELLPMKAGTGVFYDGRTLHGSPPNNSDSRRVAVSAICVPATAQVRHTVRLSPSEVETFAVEDSFFWRYVLFGPPEGVPSLGKTRYENRPRTWEEVMTADCLRLASTRPSAAVPRASGW